MDDHDLLDAMLRYAARFGRDDDVLVSAERALRASLARVREVVRWSPEGYNLVSPELDAALDALTDDDRRLLGMG